MPEFEAAPHPPMPVLRGAVPGWPPDEPLTSVNTPDAARLALNAAAATSVLDVAGMRRLWVRDVHVLLLLALVGLMGFATVQFVRDDRLPEWWLALVSLAVLVNLGGTYLTVTVCRAAPPAGVVPSPGPARWRWYRRLRQEPVVVPPTAAWPAGAEAYAVLSGAASVESVAASWLSERVGLSPTVGLAWVAVLRRQGWLIGGGRVLGLPRLPELHVQITPAGLERLERERTRLGALAAQ